jgi:acyl-CoA reductase-like NAD-dependent aldehyde dehydrogenase
MALVRPIDTPEGARRRLEIASPVSLEPIAEIEVQNADDVAEAVRRARAAQPGWAERSVGERVSYMRRALRVLLQRQDEFIEVLLAESGKTRTEALMIEIFAGCDALSHWSNQAERLLRPERRPLHGMLRLMKSLRIVYRPLGVVGVVSPWNGPFILSLNPTVQALLAGNAVVVKPSEVTPGSGLLLAKLFEAAEFPDNVVTVLTGDGETGAALVEAGVDKIAFTGSVATGRKVAEACARKLIPCTLELGGKDAMIVCEDANIDLAAGGAIAGAFMNTGHYCCGTERVYAVDSIADEFIGRVVERTGKLRQGGEGEFDIGAIFWPRQLEIIEEHVADAVARGAKLLAGGRRNPALRGLYYEPTVLTAVTHEMRIMREETFGPVLPVMRVRDEEEAIRLANDSSYGLSGTVWTRNKQRGIEIAQRIESGSVCINDMAVTYGAQEAPFGGRKHSGVGHVNGDGPRGYCHAQPILIDRLGGRQVAATYPYSLKRDKRMQKTIRFLWGTSLGRWLSR